MIDGPFSARCPGDCCRRLGLSIWIDVLTAPPHPTDDPQRDLILDLLDPRAIDGHNYPCRKWDPQTRLCTIYEQRPGMCSKYPYGLECELCNVTSVAPGEPIVRYVPASETGIFGAENIP